MPANIGADLEVADDVISWLSWPLRWNSLSSLPPTLLHWGNGEAPGGTQHLFGRHQMAMTATQLPWSTGLCKKTDQLNGQIREVEKKEDQLEKAFELLEDDFKYMEDEVREVQHIVENIDNSFRKNNLRGLKEVAEGENLSQYLENLFAACLGSDSTTEVKLKSARRLRNTGRKVGRNIDREVLISFGDLSFKSAVLDTLWDQPQIVIKWQEISFYSDLCPLTLKNLREWKFIMSKLT